MNFDFLILLVANVLNGLLLFPLHQVDLYIRYLQLLLIVVDSVVEGTYLL